MRQNRDAAIRVTLAHEGGYVDHPKDPGGATNFGITIGTLSRHLGRPATKAEVRGMTVETAIAIYAANYWAPIRADEIPHGVDLVTYDASVNSGTGRGPKWTQQAVGVKADGKVGPQTLEALRRADAVAVCRKACALRLGFMRGLKTWSTFGRGWSRRVAEIEAEAVMWAARNPGAGRVQPSAEAADARAKAGRETAAAGGSGAAGAGGGAGIDWNALPDWAPILAGLVLVVIVINFLGRRRVELERAAAYAAQAERVQS